MKLRCMMKAYIAGALFSQGERIFLEEIAKICKDIGLETFLPHRDAGLGIDVEEIVKKESKQEIKIKKEKVPKTAESAEKKNG